jgi:nicotinamidase-related amidase
MQALLVVDAQNEFGPGGLRTVPNHAAAIRAIKRWVSHAREAGLPIAWVQHFNKPTESRAFVPGTIGTEFSPGLQPGTGPTERLFTKDVFGAFSTTQLEPWLREHGVTHVVIVGFYAHMCVSTTAREALVRGFDVTVDPDATGATDISHARLGALEADEVRRSALLQLTHMGASVASVPVMAPSPASDGGSDLYL